MSQGHSSKELSWADVEFTIKCELKSPDGSKHSREDAISDDMILAAEAALMSQSHRFTNARANGEHPDKRILSMKVSDDGYTADIEAVFTLKKGITQDTLRAVMLQAIVPAVSIAAGNHFGKPKQQGRQSTTAALNDIDDLLSPRSGHRRSHAR